jgi:hypothetical protein
VKEEISNVIGDEYAELLQMVSEARSGCEASLQGDTSLERENGGRGDVWRTILASDVLPLIRAGQKDEAKKLLARLLK